MTAKLLSLTFLLVSMNISPAFGVVKAGASCAKVKSTSILNGYKYTCTLSGKKLIWSNGVKVATPLLKVKPSPKVKPKRTASPTPSSLPKPKPSPSTTPLRSDNPKPTQSPSPTAIPNSSITPTPSSTVLPRPSQSASPVQTPTPTRTAGALPTPTVSTSPSPSASASPSPSPSASASPSPSASASPSPSASASPSPSASASPSPSASASPSPSASESPSPKPETYSPGLTVYSNAVRVFGVAQLTAIGGSPANPVNVTTSTPANCSISGSGFSDYVVAYSSGTVHTLTWTFWIRGLEIGSCLFSVSSGTLSYERSVPVVGANEQFSNGLGGSYYVGQTLYLDVGLTLRSGRKLSYLVETPSICSLSGGQLQLLAYGFCKLQLSAQASSTYGEFTSAYSVGVNMTLQQTLVINAPQSLSLTSSPYFLPYTLTTGNGASELKPSFSVATPSVCSITEVSHRLKQFKINLLSVGTCTFTASQPGNNAAYSPANSVTASIDITS